MNKNFLWIAGAGIAIFLLSRLSLSKKLNFLFQSIKTGGTILQPTIDVGISVQNPTNQTAVIRSISGQITLNNKSIANISSFETQTILPNSDTLITIKARPSILGIFNTIKNVLNNQTGNNTIVINGSANVDNINLPFSISQNI